MKLAVLVLLCSLPALAQSKEDRRAVLSGISAVGIQESGVAALGGGTAGSPYLLQAEKTLKAASIAVVSLDKATDAGVPVYNIHCSAMESGEFLRFACEGRLQRRVFLQAADSQGVYAIVWTSPLVVASVPRDGLDDVEKITQSCVDALVKDWREANPPAAKAKKG